MNEVNRNPIDTEVCSQRNNNVPVTSSRNKEASIKIV